MWRLDYKGGVKNGGEEWGNVMFKGSGERWGYVLGGKGGSVLCWWVLGLGRKGLYMKMICSMNMMDRIF